MSHFIGGEVGPTTRSIAYQEYKPHHGLGASPQCMQVDGRGATASMPIFEGIGVSTLSLMFRMRVAIVTILIPSCYLLQRCAFFALPVYHEAARAGENDARLHLD